MIFHILILYYFISLYFFHSVYIYLFINIIKKKLTRNLKILFIYCVFYFFFLSFSTYYKLQKEFTVQAIESVSDTNSLLGNNMSSFKDFTYNGDTIKSKENEMEME